MMIFGSLYIYIKYKIVCYKIACLQVFVITGSFIELKFENGKNHEESEKHGP